jgi:hypothetical protein
LDGTESLRAFLGLPVRKLDGTRKMQRQYPDANALGAKNG